MEIPNYWKVFVNSFDQLFPADFSKSTTFYPNFSAFNSIGKNLTINPNNLFAEYDKLPPKNRGKIGVFKIISDTAGFKEIFGDGNWYVNVANLEYQSLDVKKVPDVLLNALDVFSSSAYARCYIDVPALPYFNQTYIHIILEKILRAELGFGDSFVKQLYAGLRVTGASTNGATIMNLSTMGTLHDYLDTITTADDMLHQLKTGIPQILEVLLYLKSNRFLFNHNDLKTKNVFVTKVGDRIIWQLADFDKSAISYKGYRFRFHNSKTAEYIGYDVFDTPLYKLNNLTKLANSNYKIAQRIMCSSFFYLSYDIYTLLVSILLHPNVIKLLGSNPFILSMVDHMFSETTDRQKFMATAEIISRQQQAVISPPVDYSSISNIASLIQDYTLKSDPNFMNYFFSETKKVNATSSYDKIYTNLRSPIAKKIILSTNKGIMSSFSGKYHICSGACSSGVCECNKYTTTGMLGRQTTTTEGKC
jgi:hypothetical protein